MSNVKVRNFKTIFYNFIQVAGIRIKHRISTKGRFKTKIPTPGDTYKSDIEVFKKSNITTISIHS